MFIWKFWTVLFLATLGYAYHACPENEVVNGCGACDGSCATPYVMCTMDCRPPACGCKNGYVRDENGKCILLNNCPIRKLHYIFLISIKRQKII